MEDIEHVPSPDGDAVLPPLVDEEGDYWAPDIRLKNGIVPQELTDSAGVTFEVDPDAFDEGNFNVECDKNSSGIYSEPEIITHQMNCMAIGDEESDDESENEKLTPFERLAKKMIPITNDEKVKKELVKPGIGSIVPEGSMVRIHYSGRFEYADEPFDSSYLQGNKRPKTFKLGEGILLPGMELGICTMKRGEISHFLIHPDYYMGELGCPPRIPGGATVLFRIELVSFSDRADVADYYSMPRAERKDCSMDLILKVVAVEKKEAKELFEVRNYGAALRKYRKAIDILEECHLADGEAEDKQRRELIILYRNAANCADKVGESSRVIYFCNAALRIDPKDAKAWYFKGKGLTREMEFGRACYAFKKALEISPNSKAITTALKELDEKERFIALNEKEMYQRMFTSANSNTYNKENSAQRTTQGHAKKPRESNAPQVKVSEEFEKIAREHLEEFKKNSDSDLPIPSARHTPAEINCLLEIACDLGLKVQDVGEGSNHHYRFSKSTE